MKDFFQSCEESENYLDENEQIYFTAKSRDNVTCLCYIEHTKLIQPEIRDFPLHFNAV